MSNNVELNVQMDTSELINFVNNVMFHANNVMVVVINNALPVTIRFIYITISA